MFLICGKGYLNIARDECLWFIDLGASFHVTPHKYLFTSYQSGEFDKVKMGNHCIRNITNIGDVDMMIDIWCILSLKDVRHVPNM